MTAAQICNTDCQRNALQTTFTSEGTVNIYDPVTKTTTNTPLPNTIGTAKCSKADVTKCELTGVGLQDDGSFAGNYELPTSLTSENPEVAALNEKNIQQRKSGQYQQQLVRRIDYSSGNTTHNFDEDGRRLQSTAANADDAQFITNPVVCTTQGSAMLFDSLSEEKYPVYLKDSLLNTNQNFDYGQFTALPD